MYDLTAIESLAYHHSMLADEVRTRTFLRAILKTVRPGDVVVDLPVSAAPRFDALRSMVLDLRAATGPTVSRNDTKASASPSST